MNRIFTSVALGLSLLVASGGDGLAQNVHKGLAAADAAMERRDYATAAREWRRLAERGNVIAQFNMGMLAKSGRGVVQDYTEAFGWYRLAAEQGYVLAQVSLGNMYLEGAGINQDYVYAHMWWNIAASRGDVYSRTQRDLIAETMTSADISRAQSMARSCVAKNYKGC